MAGTVYVGTGEGSDYPHVLCICAGPDGWCNRRAAGLSLADALKAVLEEAADEHGALVAPGWGLRLEAGSVEESWGALAEAADRLVEAQEPCGLPLPLRLVSPDRSTVVTVTMRENWLRDASLAAPADPVCIPDEVVVETTSRRLVERVLRRLGLG